MYSLSLQIVGKMGGDSMAHMNTSSAGVEPALYYPGQKRPGEDGGEDVLLFFFTNTWGEKKLRSGFSIYFLNVILNCSQNLPSSMWTAVFSGFFFAMFLCFCYIGHDCMMCCVEIMGAHHHE